MILMLISTGIYAGGIEHFFKNAVNLRVLAGCSNDVRKKRMKDCAEVFTNGLLQGINTKIAADMSEFSESALKDSDFVYLTAGFPENDELMLVECSPLKIGKKNIAVNGIFPVTRYSALITVIPNPYNPNRRGLLVFGGSFPEFKTALSYVLSCDLTADFYIFSEGYLIQNGTYGDNYTVTHVNDFANHCRIEKQYYEEHTVFRRGMMDFYYSADIPEWLGKTMAEEYYREFEQIRKKMRVGILRGRIQVYLYENDRKKLYYSRRMSHVYTDQYTDAIHVSIPKDNGKIYTEAMYQYLFMHYYGNMQYVFFYGLQQYLCNKDYFEKTVRSFSEGTQVSVHALFAENSYNNPVAHATAGAFMEYIISRYTLVPVKNAAQSRGNIMPVWQNYFGVLFNSTADDFHRYMRGFLKRKK